MPLINVLIGGEVRLLRVTGSEKNRLEHRQGRHVLRAGGCPDCQHALNVGRDAAHAVSQSWSPMAPAIPGGDDWRGDREASK